MPPTPPWRLIWWNLLSLPLSPSQAVGEPGGPCPSPVRHPHNHAFPQHRIHPASSSHFQRRSVTRQMFFIRFSRAFQRHVFSRSASLDTLRSQPQFCSLSFLRNSELSRSPFSHNHGSSLVALLYLGWLWSFSNRGRGQGPQPRPTPLPPLLIMRRGPYPPPRQVAHEPPGLSPCLRWLYHPRLKGSWRGQLRCWSPKLVGR